MEKRGSPAPNALGLYRALFKLAAPHFSANCANQRDAGPYRSIPIKQKNI